jgi:autoinducer 2-degrading protein
MFVVCVTAHVKADKVQAFLEATLDNAKNTRLEPGNLRFDVLQGEDDPARFFLYEVYKQKEDFAKHHQTAHYLRWKDAVVDWVDQPRMATKNFAKFYGDGALT